MQFQEAYATFEKEPEYEYSRAIDRENASNKSMLVPGVDLYTKWSDHGESIPIDNEQEHSLHVQEQVPFQQPYQPRNQAAIMIGLPPNSRAMYVNQPRDLTLSPMSPDDHHPLSAANETRRRFIEARDSSPSTRRHGAISATGSSDTGIAGITTESNRQIEQLSKYAAILKKMVKYHFEITTKKRNNKSSNQSPCRKRLYSY